MPKYSEMTGSEKIDALNSSLDNSLKIVQSLFPGLLGHGLHILFQDPRVFTRSLEIISARLPELNRDGEPFLVLDDKTIADFVIDFYRRRYHN